MDNLIPGLSIAAMALSALIGVAIPVALYVLLRKKGANHLPFWTGAVTFVLFAFVLEQVAYFFLKKTALWTTITGNVILLGVVGGFMAGLFEETGRFVAFKTVLRKKRGNDHNALMYGAGHGGIEAVILLSASMVMNIIFSLQFNAGQSSALGGLDAAQQLINTPSWMMLVGAVERMSRGGDPCFALRAGLVRGEKRQALLALPARDPPASVGGRGGGDSLALRRQRLDHRRRSVSHGGCVRAARRRGLEKELYGAGGSARPRSEFGGVE